MLLPLGFIAPCLPTKAAHPPTGALWVHEIKHDGFRIIARKDGNRVRLHSRAGNDLTDRFPLIVGRCDGAAVSVERNHVLHLQAQSASRVPSNRSEAG